uniref:Peptidase S72 domain-containing protein n=1 Tax=Caenorhabditis tropicalis TaxID=1561998 RepID=A0A1I7TL99_9PELO
MNLLYCLSAVVLFCGLSSCYEYNPYERPWNEQTISNDEPTEEAIPDLSEAINCTSGQICEIDVSSIKNANTLPTIVPVRVVTLSGDLELTLSTDQTLLTGLPMRTGLSKVMILYTVNGRRTEIIFIVLVSRSSQRNHQFEIVLKQPDRFKDLQGVDFLKTFAKALDGPYTSLAMKQYLNKTLVLLIHNTSLSSTECQGDAILNMKDKMVSSNGKIKEEFTRHLGSKYQIKTIHLETYDSCLLFFYNYNSFSGRDAIYVGIILISVIVIIAMVYGIVVFYIRKTRQVRRMMPFTPISVPPESVDDVSKV